ncbi:Calcineurin Binding protein 1 [Hibiscus trionum]|uniref:Calcineurin Binding protein 1 n=1 Tax=Hibiscus trionum TaxID=183268 RepID=A0A9W7IEM5_HIBTR|nr:Calcineurin Binding protein 1 [Hibiscus trionum]
MFSIAAINDTDSGGQWEPLAPTKEAQEFHLTQAYHDGLLKLQAKDYEKARELLESVLKDPLISKAQVDNNSADSHLLQLKFLALKNLATVFLQQGSSHYESALRCYLQAVEIDNKDSVVWNQLGTLSCSMGSLSISRWAFEQGLLCSPNNWNCMEKLLEVLIAIGDEVACLSVTELILRHWPSHSRALHVKNTIEESESAPFAPRGIDKLEPKHVRLKFHDKRKAPDENIDEGTALKKLNQNIELQIAEASWAALVDGLLGILLPLNGCGSEVGTGKSYRSGDVRLSILFPPSAEIVMEPVEKEEPTLASSGESMPPGDSDSQRASNLKEKESNFSEEQPQERRSTRLESLRSRKPGKEELDFTAGKDLAKIVLRLLEPFVISKPEVKDSDDIDNCSVSCADQANSLDMECQDVANFVRETSKNYGAYHMGHLLLEHAASRCLVHRDAHVKLLELEKLIRNWGQDRTPECSLFLAELYYDIGSSPSNSSNLAEFLSEASYHICKIIESVALDHPFQSTFGKENCSSFSSLQGTDAISPENPSFESSHLNSFLLSNKSPFWARYFWLSGHLSVRDGNKAKAYDEFCMSLSLLEKKESVKNSSTVQLPHCKNSKELTVERILHEINLLKVDFLLGKNLGEMIEKEMYLECLTSLAPLLFSSDSLSPLLAADPKGDGFTSVELSALDMLIKACQKIKPVDMEVYLNSHTRKLQILMALAGMGECVAFGKGFRQKSGSKMHSGPEMVSSDGSSKNWNHLVAEEVKAILQCVSQVKIFIDQSEDSSGTSLVSIFSDIQSLLLAIMYNIANDVLCKKSSMPVTVDQLEQKQSNCFIDAAIAFCKLQHLDPSVTVKTQVELIVAVHDLLAEYGLCCAGEGSEGEEAAFLKFAIKHLLALDMKLKSSFNSSNGEMSPDGRLPTCDDYSKTTENEISSDKQGAEMCGTQNSGSITPMKDDIEGITSKISPSSGQERDNAIALQKQCSNVDKINLGENDHQLDECADELTEDEKEELELMIDNALDQCFFCLYGLNLRSDSSYDDELAMHKNTSRGDYQTKEQCADVFQYLLPSAKASSRTGLVKLRRVLRTIRKHFPQPPEEILAGNIIDKFFDADLCEDKLSEMAGSEGYLETVTKMLFPDGGNFKQYKASVLRSSEPYLDIYSNLYYFLAQSEETNATDKWPGFVLTNEGEEFVQQNAKLFKYDLLYNPLRFESWQRLGNIYDEEVDLLLNDGSKHVNVSGWRKSTDLPQRVETSRRRSRRCLLISLALAKTSEQQGEIHELLALVYYDSLQNVVPFFDQRSLVPSRDAVWRMYCENSMRHFKKAFMLKPDWSHAFYIGKLSEKLEYSYETSLSYYDKAISLNPSAVDPFYRMHASRLKLLWNCRKQKLEVLKVLSTYSFSQSLKGDVMDIIRGLTPESSLMEEDTEGSCKLEEEHHDISEKMEEVWNMLYNDCLSALEICIGGDLKHFHKARFMLAQGLYKRGERGDLQKAKDELSFCFKSSRSSFTINMWEIDGMVKKGKRKTPGLAGNKKALEVNLPESSRKFITCIRKYLLFYLKLLEETGDICTLDRAYFSLKSDKRFSLCIEDLVPVSLGRHIKALVLSMNQVETAAAADQLEKIFGLFMEHGTLWPEICCLPEIKSPEISESSLYGYLHQHIVSLERNGKLEILEAINEKIRKRFKNPKLSNSNCAKVCRHASIAWYRSIIIGLASITPLQFGFSNEVQTLNQPVDGVVESSPQLCVDLQTTELWNSSFEDLTHLESLKTKWNPTLAKINNIVVKKASDGDLETANSLLRSSYNLYRESSCVMLPSVVNLSLVPSRLLKEKQFPYSIEGVEPLDLSIPRKLLLWAYTLLNGRYASISAVVKYCEENAKLKMKRGAATSPAPQNTNTSIAVSSHIAAASGKEAASHGGGSEAEAAVVTSGPPVAVSESDNRHSTSPLPASSEGQRSLLMAPQLNPCNNNEVERERSTAAHEGGDPNKG